MQIVQWLLKLAHEPPKEPDQFNSPPKEGSIDDRVTSRKIVLFYNRGVRDKRRLRPGDSSELNSKNFNLLSLLRRRDIAKACFYNTLNIRRLGSSRRRQHFVRNMKMKKESPAHQSCHQKTESAGHVGNTKVLPITDASVSSRMETNENQCPPVDKKERGKGDKKTISRMKELLRWAAAAKSDNGGKYLGRKVLQFRNRATLKSVPDDDQLSNDSPKISFRWDMESCSTTSSAYSALSLASSARHDQALKIPSVNSTPSHDTDDTCSRRRGNWITTDSEFVVLEL